MKKFENKQKGVSERRKLLLELQAEYIYINSCPTFSLFVGNFGGKKLQPSTSITAC